MKFKKYLLLWNYWANLNQIYTYWTSDGRIYVKETETSRKQTVNNFDAIMNFERSNQQHTSFKSSAIEEL